MRSGGWLVLHGSRVKCGTREYCFLLSWDLHRLSGSGPTPPLVSTWDAERALEMNAREAAYCGRSVIRKLYFAVKRREDLPSLSPLDLEAHLLSEVLHAVRSRQLVAFEVERSVPPPIPEVEELEPPPPAQQGPTWFEVRVVWDDTGEPVSGVPLVVDLGPGGTQMLETDGDGRIRVDPVPGACAVRSKADGLKYEDCAGYTCTGERPPPASPRNGRRRAPSALAVVERRRVRAGETLESVATGAKLTWQKLAKFNFGTDDRKKVNAHLAVDVGCFERAANNSDYVFTDADEPGLLLVPKPLVLNLMATGVHHVLRVMPVEPASPAYSFSA